MLDDVLGDLGAEKLETAWVLLPMTGDNIVSTSTLSVQIGLVIQFFIIRLFSDEQVNEKC